MRRPQFTIRGLLVVMLIVAAAFAGGMAAQWQLDKAVVVKGRFRTGAGSLGDMHWVETAVLADGTRFTREYDEGAQDVHSLVAEEPLFRPLPSGKQE